ncbi:hypothetical protein GALL_425970 [mine drainage metagenome]|uniref:Uncharacterized protein n=1 Tax=mine drainage metagenome TaxID=410659 RepID=A0A1J5PW71_9ZZZZ
MSCEAEKNATATASSISGTARALAASTPNACAACSSPGQAEAWSGPGTPTAAIKPSAAARQICASSSHPRRRPSQRPQNGTAQRSIGGDHRNLNTYACPTRVAKPIALRLKPSTVNQACKVPAVSASGKPDEKPSSRMAAMRRLPNTAHAETGSGSGVVEIWLCMGWKSARRRSNGPATMAQDSQIGGPWSSPRTDRPHRDASETRTDPSVRCAR